ncbi:hypothetical protein L227DRAFT_76166 [Lentinus tigrinus ALCF2SS1-6]|uniref:Secreted protein n=1 Tax=Lentinus tigrinus ALCF2SS1-6 TaxID=1328759 RepID=A0A5C2SB99_9APHY|nr:hypothetical protein L227DRAFT_76166 [Lentinus tigrinus ALCF2SS1-6]
MASDPRGLWGLCLLLDCFGAPLRPPCLSETSRIFASVSMSPALRRALAAMARVPGAGVGLENAGCDMVGSGGALVPSKFCACGRLRRGVDGMMFVAKTVATPQERALWRGRGKREAKRRQGRLDDG